MADVDVRTCCNVKRVKYGHDNGDIGIGFQSTDNTPEIKRIEKGKKMHQPLSHQRIASNAFYFFFFFFFFPSDWLMSMLSSTHLMKNYRYRLTDVSCSPTFFFVFVFILHRFLRLLKTDLET
jgi:hypothetical protein